jgi:hypothetical protein
VKIEFGGKNRQNNKICNSQKGIKSSGEAKNKILIV